MNEKELFEARIEDLCRRAERYETPMSAFLTPTEGFAAVNYVRRRSRDIRPVLYGGYDGAERTRLLVLPDYLSDGDYTAAAVRECLPELAREAVAVLAVQGSGYKILSHRDYLGSLLALSLERSVIGDIAVRDDHSALVFCDGRIASFLLAEWKTVGSDRVRVKEMELPTDFSIPREFETVSDTVASPRLDAVVAALASLSREKAAGVIAASMVELNYEVCEKGDRPVPEGAILSVRGKGKFVIRSLSELTKKGRYRLLADKYK